MNTKLQTPKLETPPRALASKTSTLLDRAGILFDELSGEAASFLAFA
jgi:hypothetical protein